MRLAGGGVERRADARHGAVRAVKAGEPADGGAIRIGAVGRAESEVRADLRRVVARRGEQRLAAEDRHLRLRRCSGGRWQGGAVSAARKHRSRGGACAGGGQGMAAPEQLKKPVWRSHFRGFAMNGEMPLIGGGVILTRWRSAVLHKVGARHRV